MNIELYYFKGCPTYIETAENLKNALNDLDVKYNLVLIEVMDTEDAVTKKFLGSPTIRVNGIDLEGKETGYIFGCRIYTIDGKMTGIPGKNFIKEKLSTLMLKKGRS